MILQVGSFLVAFLAILNTLNQLSTKTRLVLSIISAIVTFIPAAVQTYFSIRSMFRYDNGPWRYVLDALLKSLLLDEYAGYMQQVNVATGGKNHFGYSDPFTGQYQQIQVHRVYTISKGPPFEPGQGKIDIFANGWLQPGREHEVNETKYSLKRSKDQSRLELRIQFREKPSKTHNFGDVSPEMEEKLKLSLAFMVWSFANANRVVRYTHPDQKGVVRALGIVEALEMLTDQHTHLVERVIDNCVLLKIA